MKLATFLLAMLLSVSFAVDAEAQKRSTKKKKRSIHVEDPIMISPHTLRNMNGMSNKQRKRTMRKLEKRYSEQERFTATGTTTQGDTREIFALQKKVEAPHKEEMREKEQQERAKEERFARGVLDNALLTNTQRERVMQKLERARDFNRRDNLGAFERFERDKKLAKSRVSAFRFDRSRQDAVERMDAYRLGAFETLTPRQKNRYYRDIRNVNINTRSYYDADGNRVNLRPKISASISQFDKTDARIARRMQSDTIKNDVKLRNKERLSGFGVLTKEQKDLAVKLDRYGERNIKRGEFAVIDGRRGVDKNNVYKRNTDRNVFADQGRVKMTRNKTVLDYTAENTVRDERLVPNMQAALGGRDRAVNTRQYVDYGSPSLGGRLENRLRVDRPDVDQPNYRMTPEQARSIYKPYTPRPLLSREIADKDEDPRELGPDRYVSRHAPVRRYNMRADAGRNMGAVPANSVNAQLGIAPNEPIYLGGTRRQYEADRNSRAYQRDRLYRGSRY